LRSARRRWAAWACRVRRSSSSAAWAAVSAAPVVAVWASTLLILSRVDHAFINVFETPKKAV